MKLGSNSLPRDVLPAVQTAPPVLWSSFGKLCRSPSTSHTSVTMAAPPVVISSPQGDDMGWDGRKLVICDRLRKHETWDKDVGCLEGKRETEGFTFSLPFSSIWLDLRNYLGSVTARCVVFQANLVFFTLLECQLYDSRFSGNVENPTFSIWGFHKHISTLGVIDGLALVFIPSLHLFGALKNYKPLPPVWGFPATVARSGIPSAPNMEAKHPESVRQSHCKGPCLG